MPRSPLRRLAERSRLASRLLRQEVRALAVLGDDAYVAANREGVFFGRAGATSMQPSAIEPGDLPLLPPMSLSVGPAVACSSANTAVRVRDDRCASTPPTTAARASGSRALPDR